MKFHLWSYNDRKSVPSKPGIYILYLDSPIKKFYNIDKKGILYIGESEDLESRLKIIKNKKWEKDYFKNKDVMFKHPILTYVVDFDNDFNLVAHKTVTGKGLLKKSASLKLKYLITSKHKKTESKLLKGHVRLFGSLPPFNIKGTTLRSIWESTYPQCENWEKFYEKITKYL